MDRPQSRLQAALERLQDEIEDEICILDSRLEDIQVPSLLPLTPMKIAQPNRNDHRAQADRELTPTPGSAELVRPSATPVATTTLKPVPWDGKIHWALKGTTVFKDSEEERRARCFRPNIIVSEPSSHLWVFQFGLRYIPAHCDINVYRAIKVDNLPPNAALSQILPLIPGEILAARLLDTRAITGYNTALVTFVHQTDAESFLRTSNGSLILKSGQAKVAPIPTPSYPINADMERLIYEKGYTRVIRISNLREPLKGEIVRVLGNAYLLSQIESIQDGPGVGEARMRFCSIKGAAAAYVLLRSQTKFDECQWKFQQAVRPRNPHIGIWN